MRRSWCIIGALCGVLVAAGAVWYFLPVSLEDIDRMEYCACGYSRVRFEGGKIIMVKYHHATVKPGEIIGEYAELDGMATITIHFRGKAHVRTYEVDHIGLLGGRNSARDYVAVDSRSLRYRVRNIMAKIFFDGR